MFEKPDLPLNFLPQRAAGLRAYLSLLSVAVLVACGGGADEAVADATDETQVTSAAPKKPKSPTTTTTTSPTTSTSTTTSSTSTTTTTTSTTSTTPTPTATSTAWVPSVNDTWQWQLSGTINTSYAVTVYDIDLFDAPASTISLLKNRGTRVVCYFSAGSSENWRSDFSRFQASDMGNALDGWAGERWLDTRSANVREIMKARLDLAKSRGCDGVEPDNVDAYTNSPGFPLTATTQLDYNRFLAREAKARGLAIGLKNNVDQVAALAPDFDFAVNEQCNEYSECGVYTAFTQAGKPVFNAEYMSQWVTDATRRANLCSVSRANGIRTLVLPLDLNDSFRHSCD